MAKGHGAPSGPPVSRQERTRWAWVVATFFGAGYLRPGPGTYGSAAATLLWLVAGWAVHHNTVTLTWMTVAAVVVATAVGIPAATRVAQESGRPDPGFVVIDEVAGQWIALLLLPPLWPAGTGIMADDLVAGCFALVLTQVCLSLLQRLH